jgi:hypothetical protein
MNTFAMKFFGVMMLTFLVTPSAAQAYRYVDSAVVQVSDRAYMLTHTFTAGFLNEDVLTPVVATVEGSEAIGYPVVEFAIEGESNVLAGAEVNALVLSDAEIVENQYLTNSGMRDTFTLFTLVTLQSPLAATEDISLVMKSLPFGYTRDGEDKSGEYNLESAADDEMAVTAGE